MNIGVIGINSLPYLFKLLGKCFDVNFIINDISAGNNKYDAYVLIKTSMSISEILKLESSTFVIQRQAQLPLKALNDNVIIQFSNSSLSPIPFCGRQISYSLNGDHWPVVMDHESHKIATINKFPIWTIAQFKKNILYTIGMDLPTIPDNTPLFRYFNGDIFFEILPFIDFLRNITGVSSFVRSQQTACMIFDDLNLHFLKYGFVNYADIVTHATVNKYHASFATIPMDLYYANKKAISLFNKNTDKISLMIHGNNHIAHELSRDYTENQRISLLSRAINRVKKFEQKYDISISRAMAAPHGACTELILRDMVVFGFEAATVSHGSLFNGNKTKEWVNYLGCNPTTIISGLPILYRFRIKYNCTNFILLSAYLNQPIIPCGHHWDAKDNYEMLKSVANTINSIGSVRWCSIKDIMRSNYQYKIQGNTIIIKPYSRFVTVSIPSGISTMQIQFPKILNKIGELGDIVIKDTDNKIYKLEDETLIGVKECDSFHIILKHNQSADVFNKHQASTPIKAIVRRCATEMRDMFQPFVYLKNKI